MDLRVVCRWNRCSEPSQALRASSPGGRAKDSADIADAAGQGTVWGCVAGQGRFETTEKVEIVVSLYLITHSDSETNRKGIGQQKNCISDKTVV